MVKSTKQKNRQTLDLVQRYDNPYCDASVSTMQHCMQQASHTTPDSRLNRLHLAYPCRAGNAPGSAQLFQFLRCQCSQLFTPALNLHPSKHLHMGGYAESHGMATASASTLLNGFATTPPPQHVHARHMASVPAHLTTSRTPCMPTPLCAPQLFTQYRMHTAHLPSHAHCTT